ncbi:MAG: alpha-amylase family protein [Acidimicrobiales bacterium]
MAPFAVGRSSRLAAEHPDWLLKDPATGEVVDAGEVLRDRCSALDVTHPDVADYLDAVFESMASWGIDYFKIDFAYAGALAGRRHEDVTGVEADRRGLQTIHRQAIGPEATLLGCGAPLLASVGLVDAMRVGPGIALHDEPSTGNPSMPSQRTATRNTVARAWQHGRFFVNDPDCLVARPEVARPEVERPEVERREECAATFEHYGGLRSSSDRLRRLDAWGLEWGLEKTRRLLLPASTRPLVLSE